MSLHALTVPVTMGLLRSSNYCDLQHRTELLIFEQAICPRTTAL